MNVFILSGSHRPTGQTHKVSRFIQRKLEDSGHDVTLFSLANNPLPLWDEDAWSNTERWEQIWSPVSEALRRCDAIVIATPEWCGMATPGVKNFFLLLDGELQHKPCLLVAISSALNGAYCIAELRGFCTKNNQLCIIPEHIIVRKVENVLNSVDVAEDDADQRIRDRITFAMGMLEVYGDALRTVARDPRLRDKRFEYGM